MKKLIERISENFKKNRIILLVFSLLWIATIAVTLFAYKDTMGKVSYGNSDKEITIEVSKDVVVEQVLPIRDETDAISVCLVTYARKNRGHINISITDLSGNTTYADKTIDARRIQDNAFLTVGLNQTLQGQKVVVRLSSDCKGGEGIDGEAPGVYCSTYNDFQGEPFTINGVATEGSLCVRYLIPDRQMNQFYRISIISSIVFLTAMIIMLLLLEPKHEVFFAGMVLALGTIFMFIITPMSVPDEKTHYERSLQLSNSFLMIDNKQVEKTYLDYSDFYGHHNYSGSYVRLLRDFNSPAKKLDEMVEVNRIPKYCYLGYYIPQAMGITIGRLFHLNMLKTFYLGRFTNLLFYVLCIYIAIRKTPIHKLVFGILSTMPMFIHQAGSYSYDGFIFGLTFVVIAYLLKWYLVDEEITVGEYIIAFIANVLLAPAKFVYCIFSFLYWFIPEKRFKSRYRKIILTGLLCIYPLQTLYQEIWLNRVKIHIMRLFGYAALESKNTISVSSDSFFVFSLIGGTPAPYHEPYTFTYVIYHPIETLYLFIYTIRYSIKLWFYNSIGRTMSGLGLILPLRLVQSFPLLLLICSLRKEEYVEPVWLKTLFIIMCVLSALMTLFGMLLGWTSTESKMIEGLQGRYFSPLLPYFFAIFNNVKIKLSEKIDRYAIFVQVILMFETIAYILSYTFVN